MLSAAGSGSLQQKNISLSNGSSSSSSSSMAPNSLHSHQQQTSTDILVQTTSDSPGNNGGDLQNGEGGQLQVILTIRMLMQGKEVGSIIGKKGDYVRQIREQSSAKINISDGSCPERIVTISGTANAIDKAFTMIARKFEDDLQALQSAAAAITPPITLRLIVPASQCGSLIGKGGSKIRDIRDKTGASLQVASEMLSNSTEKPVTISGSSDALIGCMREICQILLDAPAKGPTIQYKPVNTGYNPLAVVSSAAAIAAAAAAQKSNKTAAMAGLPLGIAAGLQQHQLAAGLLPAANPLQASLQELALLQHHTNQHHHLNPFVDVSRFLLPTSAAAPQAAASTVLPAAAGQSTAIFPNANAAFFAAALNPALISTSSSAQTSAYKTAANGIEFYGLDPVTVALLAQQNGNGTEYSTMLAAHLQQKQSDSGQQIQQQQLLQQQQQIQLLYQQQQQQQQAVAGAVTDSGSGSHPQLSGRTIGSNGQQATMIIKEGTASAGTGPSQKRFTPY